MSAQTSPPSQPLALEPQVHEPQVHGPQVPAALATLLIKERVHLGLLSAADRALALTWVWLGLPHASERPALSEAEINTTLKAQLAGAARCLATDHVELRRWLVDSGLLQRDGFGRAYQRVEAALLPLPLQPTAQALSGLDSQAWVRERLQRLAIERAARRAAWEASQGLRQPP
jgi:Uncharacterized protein conserved in bacteria (DUF2087)